MISSPERAKFTQLNLKTSCLDCYNFSRQFPHVHTHTRVFPRYFLGTAVFWLILCLVGCRVCARLSGVTRSGDLSALQIQGEGASPLSISASPFNICTWTRRPLTFRRILASEARARNKRIFSFKGQSRQLLKRYFQIGLLGCDRVYVY